MRVLVLSDIHANLVALETVLNAAQGKFDAIWCLGDVVGYGPRPNECIEIIRERAALCVMGNHDWAVLDRPGINVDDFNPHARQAVLWTRQALTPENLAYLNQLPDTPIHPEGASNVLVTHASPREPVWEYILTPSIAMENFASFEPHLPGRAHAQAGYLPLVAACAVNAGPDEYRPATVDMLQPQAGASVALAAAPNFAPDH